MYEKRSVDDLLTACSVAIRAYGALRQRLRSPERRPAVPLDHDVARSSRRHNGSRQLDQVDLHRRRRQRGPGRMTPTEFEAATARHAAIAARTIKEFVNRSLGRLHHALTGLSRLPGGENSNEVSRGVRPCEIARGLDNLGRGYGQPRSR